EDGIRAFHVTGVQTCALPILARGRLALRALTAEIAATTAAAFTTPAEHLHLVGDDVGGVLLHAVLPGVLVVAQFAFDVDRAALADRKSVVYGKGLSLRWHDLH